MKIELDDDKMQWIVNISPKNQQDKLKEIDPNAPDAAQQYVSQRARAAYMATLCQPWFAYRIATIA